MRTCPTVEATPPPPASEPEKPADDLPYEEEAASAVPEFAARRAALIETIKVAANGPRKRALESRGMTTTSWLDADLEALQAIADEIAAN